MAPIVVISRRESFSAAHRLHSLHLTDEENVNVFGKCNSKNGHGHNYSVEVFVKGEIDQRTGMVMNLTDLKHVLKEKVVDVMDHKNLDLDVEYFKTTPSTAENIVVFIWNSLLPAVPGLFEVKLHETEHNAVSYRGESKE
ncbi:hypothetical protein DFJ73DRAFT_835950 [Zopfochytrium polystomum]|nr:hypothetical protein DFJ73DRAFT_835950 [Zopfochytrium polystomum]